MPIGLKIFVDKILVINLHLTKITKVIDLENLELYGTLSQSYSTLRGSYIPKGAIDTVKNVRH